MKVVALSCPQCGGSQDISDNLRELECRYCGIMLRVERFPNGELERLLTESKEENAELSIRNRILEIQNAIHRMDKAWETRREAFMVTTKSGQREPSTITGLMGVLFGFGLILLGGVMLSASSRNQEIGIAMPIVGVLAIIFGFSERSTSRTYEQERNAYMSRRAQMYRWTGNLQRALKNLSAKENADGKEGRIDLE